MFREPTWMDEETITLILTFKTNNARKAVFLVSWILRVLSLQSVSVSDIKTDGKELHLKDAHHSEVFKQMEKNLASLCARIVHQFNAWKW